MLPSTEILLQQYETPNIPMKKPEAFLGYKRTIKKKIWIKSSTITNTFMVLHLLLVSHLLHLTGDGRKSYRSDCF